VVTIGGLDLFPASSAIPPGPYRSSLEACGVPYQWLDATEVMRRWAAFRLDAGVHGLWQADGAMVPAARGTRRMQRLAAARGATLLDQAPVTAVRDLGGSVEVTAAGTTFRAGRLLLCTDAWTGDLLAQLDTCPWSSPRSSSATSARPTRPPPSASPGSCTPACPPPAATTTPRPASTP
jgi:sarcosine oxidase